MAAAYEDAFRRDIAQILETVPADDLAVQIDVCVEFRDIKGGLVGSPPRPDKLKKRLKRWRGLHPMCPPKWF